jgi:hypothetical protein
MNMPWPTSTNKFAIWMVQTFCSVGKTLRRDGIEGGVLIPPSKLAIEELPVLLKVVYWSMVCTIVKPGPRPVCSPGSSDLPGRLSGDSMRLRLCRVMERIDAEDLALDCPV